MSTVGNAIGTWSVSAPIRSCAGASTSTLGNSGGSHADQVEDTLRLLRELRGADWEPCRAARCQEKLGLLDVVHLHGFLIIELHNTDPDSKQPPKYLRLDWGADGFRCQEGPADGRFISYTGDRLTFYLRDYEIERVMKSLGTDSGNYWNNVEFLECVPTTASMKALIKAVDAKRDVPYDLVKWNCNHFANYLLDVLTPPSARL